LTDPDAPDPSLPPIGVPVPPFDASGLVADDAGGPEASKGDRDRGDYARRLIAARAPEVGPAELAALGAAPDPDLLPASIGERILEVLDHMMTRMERLEAAVREA
jgi:hypothetical protein